MVLTIVCFSCSCKKDNTSSSSGSFYLPKTYTEDVRSSVIGNSLVTYNLTFDDDYRITSITATPAPASLRFVYAYPSKDQVTLDLYEQGNLSIHEIFWLNAFSRVDSTFRYNNTGDSSTEKYIYDPSHSLETQKSYDYSASGAVLNNTTSFVYDMFGNVEESIDDQGRTIDYQYYIDLHNTLNMGTPYIPQSVFFVKTEKLMEGGTTETVTHYYTFDSNDRLTKDSAATTGVDLIAIKSYTY